jgi:hypothetical protein
VWFVVGNLRFKSWFDVDVLDIQIEQIHILMFWHFLFNDSFGYFFKKLGNFFSQSSAPPPPVLRVYSKVFVKNYCLKPFYNRFYGKLAFKNIHNIFAENQRKNSSEILSC